MPHDTISYSDRKNSARENGLKR